MCANKGEEKGPEPDGVAGLRQDLSSDGGKLDKREDAGEKERESWTKKGPMDETMSGSTCAAKHRAVHVRKWWQRGELRSCELWPLPETKEAKSCAGTEGTGHA